MSLTIPDYSLMSHVAGKAEGMTLVAKAHILAGKSVVFACNDQRNQIQLLTKYFPNALFELMGNWGIKVWVRRKPNS